MIRHLAQKVYFQPHQMAKKYLVQNTKCCSPSLIQCCSPKVCTWYCLATNIAKGESEGMHYVGSHDQQFSLAMVTCLNLFCNLLYHDSMTVWKHCLLMADLHWMTQTVSHISIVTQTWLSVLTTFRITALRLRKGLASNNSAGLIFLCVLERWCLKNKAFPLKVNQDKLSTAAYQPVRNHKMLFPRLPAFYSLQASLHFQDWSSWIPYFLK